MKTEREVRVRGHCQGLDLAGSGHEFCVRLVYW